MEASGTTWSSSATCRGIMLSLTCLRSCLKLLGYGAASSTRACPVPCSHRNLPRHTLLFVAVLCIHRQSSPSITPMRRMWSYTVQTGNDRLRRQRLRDWMPELASTAGLKMSTSRAMRQHPWPRSHFSRHLPSMTASPGPRSSWRCKANERQGGIGTPACFPCVRDVTSFNLQTPFKPSSGIVLFSLCPL